MASWNFGHILAVGEKKISEQGMWVEANFPKMFSLKMQQGNINALNDPSSILLSETLAKILFGNDNALNKMIKLDNKESYKVAGVFEDLPRNTSLYDAKYFLSWKKYVTTQEWLKNAATQWNNHSFQAYVQVADNVDMGKETEKIKNVVMAHKSAATEGKEQALLFPMDS